MDYSNKVDKSLQISVPTLKLREKIRDYTKSHREQLRANSLDTLRFGVGEINAAIKESENFTEKDVSGLAGRIKRRKHATIDDMYRLSHAFLQDEKNIETFSKIPGAIQILLKELTGKDSERQLSSAECLCNLSLGQSAVCDKLSFFAGSYLVTYLHTAENQIVRMCLWTIANILATGLKGSLNIMEMQLLPQLWKLYANDDIADDMADFREDAAICLQIIALNSKLLLKEVDREFILKHLLKKNPTCLGGEYHLQIIFHTLFYHPELVASFSSPQQQYLISYSLSNICNTQEFNTVSQRLKITYSVRLLANILACPTSAQTCYCMLLHQISINWQKNLVAILNKLFAFQNFHLTREVLWLLKNILNLENAMNVSQSNFVEKLKIPIIDSVSCVESMIL